MLAKQNGAREWESLPGGWLQQRRYAPRLELYLTGHSCVYKQLSVVCVCGRACMRVCVHAHVCFDVLCEFTPESAVFAH